MQATVGSLKKQNNRDESLKSIKKAIDHIFGLKSIQEEGYDSDQDISGPISELFEANGFDIPEWGSSDQKDINEVLFFLLRFNLLFKKSFSHSWSEDELEILNKFMGIYSILINEEPILTKKEFALKEEVVEKAVVSFYKFSKNVFSSIDLMENSEILKKFEVSFYNFLIKVIRPINESKTLSELSVAGIEIPGLVEEVLGKLSKVQSKSNEIKDIIENFKSLVKSDKQSDEQSDYSAPEEMEEEKDEVPPLFIELNQLMDKPSGHLGLQGFEPFISAVNKFYEYINDSQTKDCKAYFESELAELGYSLKKEGSSIANFEGVPNEFQDKLNEFLKSYNKLHLLESSFSTSIDVIRQNIMQDFLESSKNVDLGEDPFKKSMNKIELCQSLIKTGNYPNNGDAYGLLIDLSIILLEIIKKLPSVSSENNLEKVEKAAGLLCQSKLLIDKRWVDFNTLKFNDLNNPDCDPQDYNEGNPQDYKLLGVDFGSEAYLRSYVKKLKVELSKTMNQIDSLRGEKKPIEGSLNEFFAICRVLKIFQESLAPKSEGCKIINNLFYSSEDIGPKIEKLQSYGISLEPYNINGFLKDYEEYSKLRTLLDIKYDEEFANQEKSNLEEDLLFALSLNDLKQIKFSFLETEEDLIKFSTSFVSHILNLKYVNHSGFQEMKAAIIGITSTIGFLHEHHPLLKDFSGLFLNLKAFLSDLLEDKRLGAFEKFCDISDLLLDLEKILYNRNDPKNPFHVTDFIGRKVEKLLDVTQKDVGVLDKINFLGESYEVFMQEWFADFGYKLDKSDLYRQLLGSIKGSKEWGFLIKLIHDLKSDEISLKDKYEILKQIAPAVIPISFLNASSNDIMGSFKEDDMLKTIIGESKCLSPVSILYGSLKNLDFSAIYSSSLSQLSNDPNIPINTRIEIQKCLSTNDLELKELYIEPSLVQGLLSVFLVERMRDIKNILKTTNEYAGGNLIKAGLCKDLLDLCKELEFQEKTRTDVLDEKQLVLIKTFIVCSQLRLQKDENLDFIKLTGFGDYFEYLRTFQDLGIYDKSLIGILDE